ncbi:hypothetical protein QFZ86_004873, partial [Pseudomonas plecoglossicida]
KNAGLLMCLLARTSSIKSAFLFLSFPAIREEPQKSHPEGWLLRPAVANQYALPVL